MTKPCVVPQCKTGSRSVTKKVSVFRVPSNSERLKKWQSVIPTKKPLTSSHYVCEKHFEEQYILRKYIQHDANGKVMAEAIYKHPRLKESAIPTIFDDPTSSAVTNASNVPLKVLIKAISHSSSTSNKDASIHVTEVPITFTPETSMPESSITTNDTGTHTTEVQVKIEPTDDTFPSDQVGEDLELDIPPVTTSGNMASTLPNNVAECIKSLPAPWARGQLFSPHQLIVFMYPEIIKKNGVEIPVTIKTVTVDIEKNLRYYVHGNPLDNDDENRPRKMDPETDLNHILSEFAKSKTCHGIGEIDFDFLPARDAFKDYKDIWHHNECPLVWKKLRCGNCYNLRKCVLQRLKRTESLNSRYRSQITRLANPVDVRKLKIINDRTKCERLGRIRVKCKLLTNQDSLKAQQVEIAPIEDKLE